MFLLSPPPSDGITFAADENDLNEGTVLGFIFSSSALLSLSILLIVFVGRLDWKFLTSSTLFDSPFPKPFLTSFISRVDWI